MSDSSASAAATRGARRRARTRAQLIDAARTLFARDGVEPVRINEITEAADVGFGSFYNHFASKDEIVAAVVQEAMAEHGERLDALAEVLDDPAEVVAVAHRHFVRLAGSEPETGWLAVRLELTHGVLTQAVGHRAARDLERGSPRGRFDVPDPQVDARPRETGGALLVRDPRRARGRPLRGRRRSCTPNASCVCSAWRRPTPRRSRDGRFRTPPDRRPVHPDRMMRGPGGGVTIRATNRTNGG